MTLYSKSAGRTASFKLSAPSTPKEVNPERWIEERLRRGKTYGVFAEVEHVTPQIAQELLKRNTRNRTISAPGVAVFVSALREGRFRTLARGIAVANDGALNDGQHKLLAIVESGISAHVMVGWGERPEDIEVHDQGGAGSRTAAQVLGMKDIKNSALTASASRMLMVWGSDPNRRIGNDEIAAFVAANKSIIESATVATRLHGALKAKVLPPTPVAVAHFMICQKTNHPDTIPVFWDGLITGADLHGPVLVLREGLRRGDFSGDVKAVHYRGVRIVAAIINAWNAKVKGRRPRSVKWDSSSAFPEIV